MGTKRVTSLFFPPSMTSVLIDPNGLPTLFGLCIEFVRQEGRFNMITEFSQALARAAEVARTVSIWPFIPNLSFAEFSAAYENAEYAAMVEHRVRGKTLLELRDVWHAIERATGGWADHRLATFHSFMATPSHRRERWETRHPKKPSAHPMRLRMKK